MHSYTPSKEKSIIDYPLPDSIFNPPHLGVIGKRTFTQREHSSRDTFQRSHMQAIDPQSIDQSAASINSLH